MPSNATGNGGVASAWRLSSAYDFDPKFGYRVTEIWTGIKSQIIALTNGWSAAGLANVITHRGPLWQAVVQYGYDPNTTETPYDQWSLDAEPAQISIWAHPIVDIAMNDFAGGPSAFRTGIESAARSGTALGAEYSGNLVAADLYKLLCRGTEAYEVKRAVLTKTRTFSLAYTERLIVDGIERVYTTTALIAEMNIPVEIQNQLPNDPPDTPSGCRWGWKVRTDRSEIIPALGKIQETRDWVFAAWSVATALPNEHFGLYQLIEG